MSDELSSLIDQLLQHPNRQEAESYSASVANYLRVLADYKDKKILGNLDGPSDLTEELVMPRLAHWCMAAIDTIANSKHPRIVCERWSDATDVLVRKQFDRFFDSNQALICLGKWSSRELNLSSDIDLMIFSNSETFDPTSLRKFQSCFEFSTNGFTTYRLDFDLRPGGRMGPQISQLEQAKDYYFNFGQTWERVALFRFRCLNSNFKEASELGEFRNKFCFRKHLDFSVLQDLRKIRKLLQSKRQVASPEQLDLKFAFGGIRDIELYLHSLVVIHGGRIHSLRQMQIDNIVQSAEAAKLISSGDAELLLTTYWDLRRLENFTQAISDNQTHLLELKSNLPKWVTEILRELNLKMNSVNLLVESILGEPNQNISQFDLHSDLSNPILAEILELKVLSRNRLDDESERLRFVSTFLAEIPKSSELANAALIRLRDFVKATRAKSSFFSFLNQHTKLIQDLSWIFSNSEFLSQILIGKPELLDTYWLNSLATPPKDPEELLTWLLEKKLLSEIRLGSELLRGADVHEISKSYSVVMKSILSELRHLVNSHESNLDPLEVLMMGKLASDEMGFRSDLDLVFVSKNPSAEAHTKLARRFISRLTEPHRGGRIASVDLRLRPSGNAGPLVVSLENLKEHLSNSAACWERLAYLRSEFLDANGSDQLQEIILRRGITAAELSELNQIRLRLLQEHPEFSLKYSEGGVLDIELALQTLCLKSGVKCRSYSVLEMIELACPQEQKLLQNYLALRKAELLWQIIENQTSSKSHEIFFSNQTLADALKLPISELNSHFQQLLEENIRSLSNIDPRRVHG